MFSTSPARPFAAGTAQDENIAIRKAKSLGGGATRAIRCAARSLRVARYGDTFGM